MILFRIRSDVVYVVRFRPNYERSAAARSSRTPSNLYSPDAVDVHHDRSAVSALVLQPDPMERVVGDEHALVGVLFLYRTKKAGKGGLASRTRVVVSSFAQHNKKAAAFGARAPKFPHTHTHTHTYILHIERACTCVRTSRIASSRIARKTRTRHCACGRSTRRGTLPSSRTC